MVQLHSFSMEQHFITCADRIVWFLRRAVRVSGVLLFLVLARESTCVQSFNSSRVVILRVM